MRVAKNQTVVTILTVDPDVGTALTYSLIGSCDFAKFTIIGTTDALSLIAATPNFEGLLGSCYWRWMLARLTNAAPPTGLFTWPFQA